MILLDVINEPKLNQQWKHFQDNCELDIEKCSSEETKKIPSAKFLMQEYYSNLNHELRKGNDCAKIPYNIVDQPFMRFSFSEQRKILVHRLSEMEKLKVLSQKLLKELSIELDSYQKKEMEATYEADTLEHLVKTQNIHERRIEFQLNFEIQRIEKEFFSKWKSLSKPKMKFEALDWHLRTEIMPKITRMGNLMTSRKEKLEKVQLEISEIKSINIKQAMINSELKDKLHELQEEFFKVSNHIRCTRPEIRRLQKDYMKISSDIDALKNNRLEKIDEIKDSFAARKFLSRDYSEKLMTEHYITNIDVSWKITAKDEQIQSLKHEISEISQKLHNANYQISQLAKDVDYLEDKHLAVTAFDYLGNKFIKII